MKVLQINTDPTQPKMQLQIHLNDNVIASQLYQRLEENLKNTPIELVTHPRPYGGSEIVIYSLPGRVLAACGVSVVKLAGVYVIAVEQGLTSKKDVFPVDTVYMANELKITKLGFKEKVKLVFQLATTYKLKVSFDKHSQFLEGDGSWNKSSVSTTPVGPTLFGRQGFEQLTPGEPFKHWHPSEIQPKVAEGFGQARSFWSALEPGDALRNTTFDNKGKDVKTHAGGYSARDTNLEATRGLDPEHGDDFQNRSFDLEGRDPYGHDATHGVDALKLQSEKDFAGSGPLLFQNGPAFNRDPVLLRGDDGGVGFEATASFGEGSLNGEAVQAILNETTQTLFDKETHVAGDETFALSAHRISSAQLDSHLGGLKVTFDEHILLFGAVSELCSDQLVCNFELNPNDENHVKFARYILTGGAVNLETLLGEYHNLGGCNMVALIVDNTIEIKVDTINGKTYNYVAQTFSDLKYHARKPRDASGNVADVALEDNTPLPKTNTNLFIRIEDEGVFLVVNGVEHQVQVKAWNDKALLLTTRAIGYPTEAELKMLAVTLKINYGGKAKGDIEVYIGENDSGDRGLVLEFGSKPRFSELRRKLELIGEQQNKSQSEISLNIRLDSTLNKAFILTPDRRVYLKLFRLVDGKGYFAFKLDQDFCRSLTDGQLVSLSDQINSNYKGTSTQSITLTKMEEAGEWVLVVKPNSGRSVNLNTPLSKALLSIMEGQQEK